jgi:dihydroorotate dehydrogenase electron transfer subunit
MDSAGALPYTSRVPAAQFQATLTANVALSGGYFELSFATEQDTPLRSTRPGQFVMLRGDWGRDLINGRAFSVFRVQGERGFSVLGKVFGRGTARMAAMKPGDRMTVTGPLGTGFPAVGPGETQLLVAGGVGLPPLHLQAVTAARAGQARSVQLFYGGRTADDLVLVDELAALGVEVHPATDDGSRGTRGLVTVPLCARLDRARELGERTVVLACGPTPMLRAVREIGLSRSVSTFLCLEEQMACGYGVCLGCAVPVYGPRPYAYCCTDGPVLDAREVRW